MARVVILGGGVGGTIVANLVARKAKDAEVVLVDKDGKHVYQPGFLYLAFGKQKPEKLVRDERRLLHRRVRLVVDEVEAVEPEAMRVRLRDGGPLPYDYLVVATGSRLVPEEVPGHEDAHHFYGMEAALRLREALHAFGGGRVVVAIGGVPYKCPPAPVEAALLMDYNFRKRGIRDRTAITYLSPLPRLFPLETVDPRVTQLFQERGIDFTTFFNVEKVDPETHTIHSLEGEVVPYDLLVLIPPHRGAGFLQASGLTDPGGWIPTDKHTLEVQGHEGVIWALGDATDIPISKAGATAHYEARVVGKNLARLLKGKPATERYDGRVMCFFDTGFRKGLAIRFDYGHPPDPPPVSRRWYLGKVLFNKLYWTLIPTARA